MIVFNACLVTYFYWLFTAPDTGSTNSEDASDEEVVRITGASAEGRDCTAWTSSAPSSSSPSFRRETIIKALGDYHSKKMPITQIVGHRVQPRGSASLHA